MPEDRVKHEIEEILERADQGAQGGPDPRFRRPGRGRSGDLNLTGLLVVIAVVLMITALAIRNLFLPLALAGVALLLVGYWLALRSRGGSPGGPVRRVTEGITPGRLLVAAVVLLVLGLVLKRWFPYFGALAFFLFLWAYWIAWPKRKGGQGERRWRGEVVDYPESFWSKVRRWIRGR
jgi:Flp pilus assembly protein TadB